MSIYVETRIHGSLDDLWEKTQVPELHQRWDARFHSIQYLPRDSERQPQRFTYSTRIGCGFSIAGTGETVAECEIAGRRTSSLKFWSDDPKSLIREGAGYWQYFPSDPGIRFITGYDYQTRFGGFGRAIDRYVFRPLMGWATAWSFDRLRLWIEKGIPPEVSLRQSLIHACCRMAVAFTWLYQGIVPKLIARHSDELRMLYDVGISSTTAPSLLFLFGWAEVAIGLSVLIFHQRRWPLLLTIVLMLLATIAVSLRSQHYLAAAFNPVSLNFLLATLSLIGLMTFENLPRASRCLRVQPETE